MPEQSAGGRQRPWSVLELKPPQPGAVGDWVSRAAVHVCTIQVKLGLRRGSIDDVTLSYLEGASVVDL